MPESKRYPEDEAEYAVVLARHNCVLGKLTTSGRKVVLLSTGYSHSPEPIHLQPELRALDPHALPWRSLPMHESEVNRRGCA